MHDGAWEHGEVLARRNFVDATDDDNYGDSGRPIVWHLHQSLLELDIGNMQKLARQPAPLFRAQSPDAVSASLHAGATYVRGHSVVRAPEPDRKHGLESTMEALNNSTPL